MHVSIAQANLPNMYLEYSPISCWFFSPQLAFALEAFVHLYAAVGTLPVFDVGTKHLVKNNLSICLEAWKNLYGRSSESEELVKNLHGKCDGCLKKNEKHIWENDVAKIWKSEEFVWKREGFYIVQRYSKYRFFDVNCILKYSKYCFSSSIPGMSGEAKISIPYSVWVEDLNYIYICIHVVMSWDVLSVGVSTANW